MSRVLKLPSRGTLLVATDLHGHLGDFRAIVARFLACADNAQAPPRLVICGDLVHGPAIKPANWPDHLGTFYRDQTPDLLDEARRLQERFPEQVHYLLGNHEHAHLGGPPLSKFHPDEAAELESHYAPGEFETVRRWMTTWPVAAVAPTARLVMTHAAPHAQISAASELETLPLTGFEHTPLDNMADSGPIGALLWARTTTSQRAYAFLRALDPLACVAVFGHDPIREGHLTEREPLLCLSTSFGCHDGDKVYLEWNLSTPATSAAVVVREGLESLHPSAPRVFRA